MNAGAADVILWAKGGTSDIALATADADLTGALVDLQAGRDITQVEGSSIAATNAVARAVGNIDLDSTANAMGTIAAVSTGTGVIDIVDSDALIVGSVTS